MDDYEGQHYIHGHIFAYYPLDTSNIDMRYNFKIGMHSHNHYEINIVTKGESTHYLGEYQMNASPGCVFVIPPNVSHGFDPKHPVDFCQIVLGDAFMARYAEELKTFPGFHTLFEISPMLRHDSSEQTFLKLNEAQKAELQPLLQFALHQRGEGDHVVTGAMALAIVGLLCRYIRLQYTATVWPSPTYSLKAIVESLEYIHIHYPEKITISLLAENAHLSRATFLRYFKSICRCSPAEYLTKYRIKKAQELILNTELSFVQIAIACGFFDQAHFTKKFTQATGESPGQYRSANKRVL